MAARHHFTAYGRYDIVATRIGVNQMENKERQFIPGPGILLLAIVLLSVLGAIWRDYNGVRFGLIGALIWGMAVLVSFVLGTAWFSRRLLPIQDDRNWSEGFRLLWKNYLRGLYKFLFGPREDTSALNASKKKKKPGADELSPSFKRLNAGFLPAHQAAVISADNAFTRAAGPGWVILGEGETISQVFDLRPQSRKMSVSATTRDGIPVEAGVSVTFQVRQPSADQPRLGSVESDIIPYPYNKYDLFQLARSTSMAGDKKQDWTEQVAPQAAALLVTEIAKFRLDELLEKGGADSLKTITDRIKRDLEARQDDGSRQTLSRGLEIISVRVAPLELPTEVTAKRLSTWQVEWQNRVSQEVVGGDIEARRAYQQARARAQVESIENLLLNIEAMRRRGNVDLSEIIMLRSMKVIEAISSDRLLASSASQSALRDLATEAASELRLALGTEPGEDE